MVIKVAERGRFSEADLEMNSIVPGDLENAHIVAFVDDIQRGRRVDEQGSLFFQTGTIFSPFVSSTYRV